MSRRGGCAPRAVPGCPNPKTPTQSPKPGPGAASTAPAPPAHDSQLRLWSRESPEPISFLREPGCAHAGGYLFTTGDAEQLSGCSVGLLRAREAAAAEIPQYFPVRNVGEALVAAQDRERVALDLLPHREELLQADLSHPPWTTAGCAGHWCSRVFQGAVHVILN